jgi:hypothetical protein
MPSPLSRRNVPVPASLASREHLSLPRLEAGSASASRTFRDLLSVHSRYGLHVRRVTQGDPLHRRLQSLLLLATAPIASGRSNSCRVGFAPTGMPGLCTAHLKPSMGARHLFHTNDAPDRPPSSEPPPWRGWMFLKAKTLVDGLTPIRRGDTTPQARTTSLLLPKSKDTCGRDHLRPARRRRRGHHPP